MLYREHELLFCPLGGVNEIGMNVNLYHYGGKWIMVDLGAGFADDYYPGVAMLAPDISFVEEVKEDFLGIVLTHAHEDHLGSVGYLWDQLRCPIYATPFTAVLVKNKLAQAGLEKEAEITIIQPGERFDVGPFALDFVQLTHSIPEMQAVVLNTDAGRIVHTGDWKFDPTPVIGDVSDTKTLKRLGDEGVLALVCDSTNVFNANFSGSEAELLSELSRIIDEQDNLVVLTTFASNVARMHTVAKAAEACGRKVILAGRSLQRIDAAARSCGYFEDLPPFLSDDAMSQYKRSEILVMATGCQGELNAAMNKITYDRHPKIKLRPDDTVLFSSRLIPGNEKKIGRLLNALARKNVHVITSYQEKIHVSGHPSREELKTMYELVRPEIAVPVHGEPIHLQRHAEFAQELKVPSVLTVENGALVKLAPGKTETLMFVPSGYFAVDGDLLQPEKGHVMRDRRRLRDEGAVMVSFVIDKQGQLVSDILLETPGVLDKELQQDDIEEIVEDLAGVLGNLRKSTRDNLERITVKTVRNLLRTYYSKKPLVTVQIHQM